MNKTIKPSERRKYRRYDMPSEKRDAYLIWDDEALHVECVNFSAGGCAIYCETEAVFEVGQIVFLKNDQGKFRVRIANIEDQLEGVRLGCEYIESVVSDLDILENLKSVKQRKFKSTCFTDPTMMMGLVVFGIVACVIYTVIANHEVSEENDNRSDNRIVTTRKKQTGPRDFSPSVARGSKKPPVGKKFTEMQKRVKKLNEESQKYLVKIRDRIVGVDVFMKRMGIDTQAIFKSLRNTSIPAADSGSNSSENTDPKTTIN